MGKRSEELAAFEVRSHEAVVRFLRNRGYEILSTCYTCKHGQADIIARDGDAVVFVEVKGHREIEDGMPEEAISASKRKRAEQVAMAYLCESELCDIPVRFDIIALVAITESKALIRHNIGAFSGGLAA